MNAITLVSLSLVAFLATSLAAQPSTPNRGREVPRQPADTSAPANQKDNRMQQHPYVGMWVTADGRIRQELLPEGRYDEARGDRQSAYQGRYEIHGKLINYWDDTGFTADGTFVSQDELHHGGMVFYRRK